MNLSILNEKNRIKVLIYRFDKKILLKKEDNKKKSPSKSKWDFFSFVTNGDKEFYSSIKKNISKELNLQIKENYTIKNLSEIKKFKLNFLPVEIKNSNSILKRNKHSKYKWVSIAEMMKINLNDEIYLNMFGIAEFYLSHFPDYTNEIKFKLENEVIKKLNLRKKNDRVFYAKNLNFTISKKNLYIFLFFSKIKKIPVSRICLHYKDTSLLHEMYMFHSQPFQVGPLKQNSFESISYHIIDGSLEILLNENEKFSKVLLCSENKNNLGVSTYRLNPKRFRLIKSISQYCIFLEINNGPFKDKDTIWLNKRKNK